MHAKCKDYMVLTQTIEQTVAREQFRENYKNFTSVNVLIDHIQLLYDCGGPNENEYVLLNDAMMHFRSLTSDKEWKEACTKITSIFGDSLKNSTLGHAFLKPYGYAGDFEIIDKVYQEVISEDPMLNKWDLFHNQTAATKAVRNRKTFFKDVLKEKVAQTTDTCQILDVASGPCRDLLEFFEEKNNQAAHFDCVEADINAILHATKLNRHFLPKLRFYNKNIFRFKTEKKYDLVWSAGLFDYFEDKTFTRLLTRLISFVKPGGELIIGNFAEGNPTEGYMELFLDWYLHHRSPAKLIQLAQDAGIEDVSRIKIDKEEEGINLFMRIQF